MLQWVKPDGKLRHQFPIRSTLTLQLTAGSRWILSPIKGCLFIKDLPTACFQSQGELTRGELVSVNTHQAPTLVQTAILLRCVYYSFSSRKGVVLRLECPYRHSTISKIPHLVLALTFVTLRCIGILKSVFDTLNEFQGQY